MQNPATHLRTTPAIFFQKYTPFFLIALCLLIGFMLRFGTSVVQPAINGDDLLQNTPLLTNVDGYYYLNIAKEINDGSYSTTDPLRIYPEGFTRPAIPPLLSVLVAGISRITPFTLDEIGVVIPVFLGLLIALPLYLLGNLWGGRVMAFCAVLVGLVASGYSSRTAYGVLDTDCLNVFFPLLMAYFFLQFGLLKDAKRYGHLLAGLLCALLFLWWWDIARGVVTLFALLPLGCAVLFHYRPGRKEGVAVSGIVLAILLVFLFNGGFEQVSKLTSGVTGQFSYIFKQQPVDQVFPGTGMANSEQQALSYGQLARRSLGNTTLFTAALIGLCWLLISKPSQFVVLLPILAVGLLSLTSVRFMIFMAPISALGLGYLLSRLHRLLPFKILVTGLICCLMAVITWKQMTAPPIRTPIFHREAFAGMRHLQSVTPEDGVTYAWWDEGHPLVYFSQRPTLADGMLHGGERTIYLAFPLATDNFRLSANFMQFFATHGLPGIRSFVTSAADNQKDGFAFLQDILAKGPQKSRAIIEQLRTTTKMKERSADEWLDHLFPGDSPPIHLFLDNRLLSPRVQRWIYWFGTWDSDKQSGDKALHTFMGANRPLYPGDLSNNTESDAFAIDPETGMLSNEALFKREIPLTTLIQEREGDITVHQYGGADDPRQVNLTPDDGYAFNSFKKELHSSEGQYVLEDLDSAGGTILQDKKLADMVLKRLFIYNDTQSAPYFTLKASKKHRYQIWEVQGEQANIQRLQNAQESNR